MKKIFKSAILGIATIASSFLPSLTAQAESQNATITASVAETLSLTLSANAMNFDLETNDLYTDFINVTGHTNSANGYTISFNANNNYNDLKHSNTLVETTIASIQGPRDESDFPEKSWGYSIDDSDYTFKKIPLTPKNIFETSTQGENVHKFTTGIKGSVELPAGDYENELLFTIVANPLTDSEDLPDLSEGDPKAILGANNNLNFVFDQNTYTVGEAYIDNLGETEIVAVYEVPRNSQIIDYNSNTPWKDIIDTITSVNFAENFHDFRPKSTAGWFKNGEKIASFTGTQNINMSGVVDATSMFQRAGYNAANFSIDATGWDTSHVRSMKDMFQYTGYSANSWNIVGIKDWDVSNVTTMEEMFERIACEKSVDINLDLSGWDAGKVTNMNYFLNNAGAHANSFNINLNDWDVSSLTNASMSFYFIGSNAKDIVVSLNNWNAKSLTNMNNMFQSIGYNQDSQENSTLNFSMKNFKAPKMTSIGNAFYYLGYHSDTANIDMSGWTLSGATSLYDMFNEVGMYSSILRLNTSNWKINNVTNLSYMYDQVGYYTGDIEIDVSNWQMASAQNMSKMFSYVGFCNSYNGPTEGSWNIKGLNTFNTSNVTDMHSMFYGAAENNPDEYISLDLSNWNTSKVTDMSEMFKYFGQAKAKNVSLNASGWDVSNVTNMYGMFNDFGQHATGIVELNLADWELNPTVNTDYMFYDTGEDSGFVAPF